MKKRTNRTFGRVCATLGAVLLVAAAILSLWWQWDIRASEERMQSYVQTIRTLIPEPRSALAQARGDNAMAVLSLDGTDFIGLLELPRYGAALAIGADWGAASRHPCRFGGSVYDGTMQIGGTTQKGQFDFYREISAGDIVCFTDMEGNRYSYTVTDIRYEKHADQTALQRKEASLTLFIKNIYAFEYIVIFCTPAD